jgi:dTDP-4-dehydrorhamnose reductase
MASKDNKGASKPRLLVTGASGLLGHALCEMALEKWAVYGIYRRHRPCISGIKKVQADLTDPGCPDDMLGEIRPQAVIHLAAITNVAACEQYPQKSEIINAVVPSNLAKLCAQAGIAFVFTSTDLVFNGLRAPYDEYSTPEPVCIYGEQKVRAEKTVLDSCPSALVCRMPLLIGISPYHHRNFNVEMIRAIRSATPINLFVDEYRTPVDVYSAAHGILTLLNRAGGLYHLGGRTRISRFDLGIALARHLEIVPTMIRPVCIGDVRPGVQRAGDCTLISNKAYGLGYNPAALEKGLQDFVRRCDWIASGAR